LCSKFGSTIFVLLHEACVSLSEGIVGKPRGNWHWRGRGEMGGGVLHEYGRDWTAYLGGGVLHEYGRDWTSYFIEY